MVLLLLLQVLQVLLLQMLLLLLLLWRKLLRWAPAASIAPGRLRGLEGGGFAKWHFLKSGHGKKKHVAIVDIKKFLFVSSSDELAKKSNFAPVCSKSQAAKKQAQTSAKNMSSFAKLTFAHFTYLLYLIPLSVVVLHLDAEFCE